jgi:hypothetical protein
MVVLRSSCRVRSESESKSQLDQEKNVEKGLFRGQFWSRSTKVSCPPPKWLLRFEVVHVKSESNKKKCGRKGKI